MSAVAPNLKNASTRLARTAGESSLTAPRHILLSRVPKSCTTADIRRAIFRENVQGVDDIALIYSHWVPTGQALITFTKPNFIRDSLRAMDKLSISGIQVQAKSFIYDEPEKTLPNKTEKDAPPRLRGSQGRADAARRGVFDGNGPHAGGLPGREQCVTITGFPTSFNVEMVDKLLKDFDVVRLKNGAADISKNERSEYSFFSRFLVRLTSEHEAQRLVRHLHMTPNPSPTRFPLIRAHVIY